jgi:hypothetical protein
MPDPHFTGIPGDLETVQANLPVTFGSLNGTRDPSMGQAGELLIP